MLNTIEQDRLDIYNKASEVWGKALQIDLCVEELAELIQALCKLKRGKSGEKVIEELADVYIMLEQIRFLLNSDQEIEQMIAYKLSRLKKRVEKSK